MDCVSVICKWVNTVGKYRQIVCVFGMSWMVTGFVYVYATMWGQCEQLGAGRMGAYIWDVEFIWHEIWKIELSLWTLMVCCLISAGGMRLYWRI